MLGPRGYSFSRPQRVHFYYGPVTRSLPWGEFFDRVQSFSFHHLCYPNYGALTFTPAGLSPAEHASLRWTHNRTGRFPASGLYGAFIVKGASRHLVVLCIPFFCSTRAASILPSRPHISIAVARSGGQGRRFFSAAEGLSLTDASTAAGCRRSGGWPRDDPRGACHWPRSIARTTLVFG